jgi:hypothetical protein
MKQMLLPLVEGGPFWIHSKLCSITLMATKVHVILRSFVVLTWMRVTIESI